MCVRRLVTRRDRCRLVGSSRPLRLSCAHLSTRPEVPEWGSLDGGCGPCNTAPRKLHGTPRVLRSRGDQRQHRTNLNSHRVYDAQMEEADNSRDQDSWRSTAAEWSKGAIRGKTGAVSLASLVVFVVTGATWVVQHTEHWPGGYLPWMVTLGASLLALSFFLNFRDMRAQRIDAVRTGLKIVPMHGTRGSTWRLTAQLQSPEQLVITVSTDVELHFVRFLRVFVEDPEKHENWAHTLVPPGFVLPWGGPSGALMPRAGDGYVFLYPEEFENAPPIQPGRYGITAQALLSSSLYPQHLASASFLIQSLVEDSRWADV